MKRGYDGHDAGRALIAALAATALSAHVTLTVVSADQRPWESATFTGARHVLSAALDGPAQAVGRWLSAMPEMEFTLSHHIVADIAVSVQRPGAVTIEALTVAND